MSGLTVTPTRSPAHSPACSPHVSPHVSPASPLLLSPALAPPANAPQAASAAAGSSAADAAAAQRGAHDRSRRAAFERTLVLGSSLTKEGTTAKLVATDPCELEISFTAGKLGTEDKTSPAQSAFSIYPTRPVTHTDDGMLKVAVHARSSNFEPSFLAEPYVRDLGEPTQQHTTRFVLGPEDHGVSLDGMRFALSAFAEKLKLGSVVEKDGVSCKLVGMNPVAFELILKAKAASDTCVMAPATIANTLLTRTENGLVNLVIHRPHPSTDNTAAVTRDADGPANVFPMQTFRAYVSLDLKDHGVHFEGRDFPLSAFME
jgi:hypothetical protein